MMQLVDVRYGNRDQLVAPSTSARVRFSFPAPVNGAYAILRSFYLGRDDSDMQLKEMQVSLRTLFDPLQSTTDGEVEIDFRFTGSTGFLSVSSDLLRVEVGMVVVGV